MKTQREKRKYHQKDGKLKTRHGLKSMKQTFATHMLIRTHLLKKRKIFNQKNKHTDPDAKEPSIFNKVEQEASVPIIVTEQGTTTQTIGAIAINKIVTHQVIQQDRYTLRSLKELNKMREAIEETVPVRNKTLGMAQHISVKDFKEIQDSSLDADGLLTEVIKRITDTEETDKTWMNKDIAATFDKPGKDIHQMNQKI